MSTTADNPKLCGVCGLMHPTHQPCANTGGPTGFLPPDPERVEGEAEGLEVCVECLMTMPPCPHTSDVKPVYVPRSALSAALRRAEEAEGRIDAAEAEAFAAEAAERAIEVRLFAAEARIAELEGALREVRALIEVPGSRTDAEVAHIHGVAHAALNTSREEQEG